jgi:protein gp37
MAEHTKISWCDHTFNPWRGCTKVSPGCTHCYAETLSKRNPGVLGEWGPSGTRPIAAEAQWREPLRWNRIAEKEAQRHLVFCASLADVFEAVPEHVHGAITSTRLRLWNLIRDTPWLDWLLLTKRPERIGQIMPHGSWPNVWLGTSVESDDWRWRIDALVDAPQEVPVRFLSAEPLLGPLHLDHCIAGLQWVIGGGESGGHAREMRLEWMRHLVGQCQIAKVAIFVKQLGDSITYQNEKTSGRRKPLMLLDADMHRDRKGANWLLWPEDLRVRQFPFVQEPTP